MKSLNVINKNIRHKFCWLMDSVSTYNKGLIAFVIFITTALNAFGQNQEGKEFFDKFKRDVKFCICDYKNHVERLKKAGLYNGTRIDGAERRKDACIKNTTRKNNEKYEKLVTEVVYKWMKYETGVLWGVLKKTTTKLDEAYVKELMEKCD